MLALPVMGAVFVPEKIHDSGQVGVLDGETKPKGQPTARSYKAPQ